MRVVCTVVCASKVVIWGCWLGSEKKQDKCVELVEGWGGGQACRGLGWRVGELGGHVLLLSHVALGTVTGER